MRILRTVAVVLMLLGCSEDKKSTEPVECLSCGTGQVYWDSSVDRCRDDNTGQFVATCCCATLQNASLFTDFEYRERADTNGSIITSWNDLYLVGSITNHGPKTMYDVGLKVWRVGNSRDNYYVVGPFADSMRAGNAIDFEWPWPSSDRDANVRLKYVTH